MAKILNEYDNPSRPLRVALIIKGTPATLKRDDRNMGYWSYSVPEFEWVHMAYKPNDIVDVSSFHSYDFVFVEDSGMGLRLINRKKPVVFLAIDSTLSDPHYMGRLATAKQANLVLVDHDKLERFACGVPVRRWAHCVNDKVFHTDPAIERSIDVNFRCASGAHKNHAGGVERETLRGYLHGVCQVHGWSYVSGTAPLPDYAADMRRSRVVVNWPRTPINRPHRIFDAMASGAAVVTGRLPFVDGDGVEAGRHYLEFDVNSELPAVLEEALSCGLWETIASAGHEYVMKHHTWATRAKQLRQMVKEEFGL